MYTEEMLESIKKVEATRDERLHTEPRRLSADEKDALADGIRIIVKTHLQRSRSDRTAVRRLRSS